MAENIDPQKLEIRPSMDASGVVAGAKQVVGALDNMGDAAASSSAKTASSIDKSAKAAEKSSKAFARSIQVELAAMEAGGKRTAAFYEKLAEIRNIPKATAAPLVEQLKLAETAAAAKKAAEEAARLDAILNRTGNTAKQTAAAMRQVPAQLTDIIVSLQGGQAPLTVLLQQGGQLKDIFGGVGAAAREMGRYVAGLVNPFTITVAAIAATVYAFVQGSKEASTFNKTLVLTGNIAGKTADDLMDMSRSIADTNKNITQSRAAEVINQLAGSAAAGVSNIEKLAEAAIKFEKAGGGSAEKVAEAFAKLAESPLEAARELNKTQRFLTESTYLSIKALAEQGNTVGAARVAIDAYFDAISQRTPHLTDNLGYAERLWKGIVAQIDAAKKGWDDFLSVGRASTIEQQIATAQARIATLQQRYVPGTALHSMLGIGNEIAQQRDIVESLREQERIQKRLATAQQTDATAAERRATFEKLVESSRSNQHKIGIEIAAAQAAYDALATKTAKDLLDLERKKAEIRDKYRDKRAGKVGDEFESDRSAAKEWADFYLKFTANVNAADAAVAGLTKTQALLVEFLKSRGYAEASESARALVLDKARLAIQIELTEQQKKLAAANISSAKAAEDSLKKYKDEEASLAQVGEKQIALKSAIELTTVARLEEQLYAALPEGNLAKIEAIEREIAARKELANVMSRKEFREASNKAAEDAAKTWEKFSDQIGQSITDSLFRAFEQGKGFAEAFRDTVVNTFKTMVLRPGVEAVARPIGSAVLSSIGVDVGGSAIGQFGAKGIGGLFGSSSAYNAILAGGSEQAAMLAAQTAGMGVGTSQAAMLAAQTGEFGLAGLTATAEAAGTTMAGSFLSAIPGWGWAALAGAAILGMGGGGGPYITRGGLSRQYSAVGATMGSTPLEGWGSNAASEDFVTAYAASITKALGSFDLASALQVNYSQSDGRGGLFESLSILRDAQGGAASPTYYSGELGRSAENFALVFARGALNALQASELPASVEAFWAGLTPETATLEQINQAIGSAQQFYQNINSLRDALDLMPFANVRDLSFDAAAALVQFGGGLEQLRGNIDTYLQNFYTADEQRAYKVREIASILRSAGAQIDESVLASATRDQFRAVAEAQDLNTASGQKLYAALMSVSGAFASITQDIATTGGTLSKVMASLLEDRRNLEIELLRAGGNTTAALAAQRAIDTQGYTDAERAAYDYNQTLRDQITVLDAAGESVTTAFDALQRTVGAAREAANVAVSTTDAALRGVERAAVRQREALNTSLSVYREQANAINGLFDLLDRNIASLRQSAASPADMAAQGSDFIAKSLSAARTTGYLPDTEALSSAIDKVRAGLDQNAFASEFEARRAQALFANQLDELQSIAGSQKTGVDTQIELLEAQIAGLDDVVEQAKTQINALRGIDDSVLSVGDAVDRLHVALADEALRRQQLTAAESALTLAQQQIDELKGVNTGIASLAAAIGNLNAAITTLATLRTSAAGTVTTPVTPANPTTGVPQSSGLSTATQPGGIGAAVYYENISSAIRNVLSDAGRSAQDQAQAIADAAHEYAVSQQDIATALQISIDDVARYLANYGLNIPAFALGGSHDGGLRIVGERGPELEATGPARYWNFADTAAMMSGTGGDSAMAAELRALRQEQRDQSRAMVQFQRQNLKLLERWDGDGMPEVRVVV